MLKPTFFLLFNRKRFLAAAKVHYEEMLHEQQKRDKTTPAGDVVKLPFYEIQAGTVRRAVGYSLVLVVLVIIAGWAAGYSLNRLFGPPNQLTARLILYFGIGILLWATLGKGGWKIQSWKGTSLPEKVDDILFRALHLIGSFFLVLSATWAASYFS